MSSAKSVMWNYANTCFWRVAFKHVPAFWISDLVTRKSFYSLCTTYLVLFNFAIQNLKILNDFFKKLSILNIFLTESIRNLYIKVEKWLLIVWHWLWNDYSVFVFFPSSTGHFFSILGQPSLNLWKEESYVKSINNPLDMKQALSTVPYWVTDKQLAVQMTCYWH